MLKNQATFNGYIGFLSTILVYLLLYIYC